jgi:hypothetical protein
MPDDPATGIPNPDKPGHWLVPPWPNNSTFSDVVRHFLQFHPWSTTDRARLIAYFDGYEAALNASPADLPAGALHARWCADMHDCVTRCAQLHREGPANAKKSPGEPGRGRQLPGTPVRRAFVTGGPGSPAEASVPTASRWNLKNLALPAP